jgi:CDP-paratose 2-epimerase
MRGLPEKTNKSSREGSSKVRAIFPDAIDQRISDRPVLITGGAGFVGTNLADHLLTSGRSVLIFDNLSRPGVEKNVAWLREVHGSRVRVEQGDIRDRSALRRAVQQSSQVFHFAAQVAVTTSLVEPMLDVEINLLGTLNLLEELRALANPLPLVFTSTNKVYGGLDDIGLHLNSKRYEPVDPTVCARGIGESRPLDFHSPYGCSKGAADQYVIDYARTFGLPAVVFRMSCIYGPHQFGTEDQGWVAHFVIRALENRPINIFGDGMQVRDILFVEDLVEAFLLAQEHMDSISGHAFNIGGGPENTVSLLELLDFIRAVNGRLPDIHFDAWRPGDQRYYVTDSEKFKAATSWNPVVSAQDGVGRLYRWLMESRETPLSVESFRQRVCE